MNASSLGFYALLARVFKSYRAKLLVVLLLAFGIPLLIAAMYLGVNGALPTDTRWEIFGVLAFGLSVGIVVLWFGLEGLLAPFYLTHTGMRKYLDQQVLPALPIQYEDDAGQLMRDTQFIITEHDRRAVRYDDAALTDHLTHALNRRTSETRLLQEMEYAILHLQPFALALMDLDHFQEINKQYGFAVGDQCMRHIGAVIRAHIRQEDWLGRWGGDEFILVMHHIDRAKLEPLLKRLTEALQTTHNPNLPPDIHLMISMSVGATMLRPGDTPETLLAKADAALYQSKTQGRGNVTFLDERVNPRAPRST